MAERKRNNYGNQTTKKLFQVVLLLIAIQIITSSFFSQALENKIIDEPLLPQTIKPISQDLHLVWNHSTEEQRIIRLNTTFEPGYYFFNLVWETSDKTEEPGYEITFLSNNKVKGRGLLKRILQDERRHITSIAVNLTEEEDELLIVVEWSISISFSTGELVISSESSVEKIDLQSLSTYDSIVTPKSTELFFSWLAAYEEMSALLITVPEDVQKVTIRSVIDHSKTESFSWLKVDVYYGEFLLVSKEITKGGEQEIVFNLVPPTKFTLLSIQIKARGSGSLDFTINEIKMEKATINGESLEDELPKIDVPKFTITFWRGQKFAFGPIGIIIVFVGGGFFCYFFLTNTIIPKIVYRHKSDLSRAESSVIVIFVLVFIYILADYLKIYNETHRFFFVTGTFYALFVLFFVLYFRLPIKSPRFELFNTEKIQETSPMRRLSNNILNNFQIKHHFKLLTSEQGENVNIQPILFYEISNKEEENASWSDEEVRKNYAALSSLGEVDLVTEKKKKRLMISLKPLKCERTPEKIEELKDKIRKEGKKLASYLKVVITSLHPLTEISILDQNEHKAEQDHSQANYDIFTLIGYSEERRK